MSMNFDWNSIISELPNSHFLQTFEWGQVKAKYGWNPFYAVWLDDGRFLVSDNTDAWSLNTDNFVAACLVLKRTIPIRGLSARLSMLYAPKGPLLNWSNESLRNRVLDDLQSFAEKQGAIFLKMDPDVVLGSGIPGADGAVEDSGGAMVQSGLKQRGWIYSSEQIQFRNSVLIDLIPPDDEILARMKQKTRYNIRLAEKKGLTVRVGTANDFPMLYKMYAETSVRDEFVIRDEAYYQTVWRTFLQTPIFNSRPRTIPLIAEVDNEPVAGLFLFTFAGKAYYIYGMSREVHREKMPAYLLQWEAIKRARAAGCTGYDLWGAPETFNESDSMWGVYRFKEGLGGRVIRSLGAWDYAPNRFWYRMYSEIIPRLLGVMRSRGKSKTKRVIGGA